jgi:hypothetical protein
LQNWPPGSLQSRAVFLWVAVSPTDVIDTENRAR